MDNDEIKRRLNKRIYEDDAFANEVWQALDAKNNYWLNKLIELATGVIVGIITPAIRNWLYSLFRE